MSVPTQRIPARTLLYQIVHAQAAVDEAAPMELTLAQPRPYPGAKVCEYILWQAANVVCSHEVPTEDTMRGLGCDGWQSADGTRVLLLEPGGLLHLVDDNKQHGFSQALLTDMFRHVQR